MLLFISLFACKKDEPVDAGPSGPARVTILHTNDWQSHMLGQGPNAEYTPDIDGDDQTIGGIARVATLVAEIRESNAHPTVLYDGGDWMAGALFQVLATSHAAELQMMQDVGYDAVTIGNHEFDWGPGTLGDIITKADELGVEVPIIASNLEPDSSDKADDALEAHFDSQRVQQTRIDTLDNGVTVGLFGLMGDEAAAISPAIAPTLQLPAAEEGAKRAAELRDEVDLVVAITHSDVGEDRDLASEAKGKIDVIVGGHGHTPLHDYVTEKGTIILQAGAFTQYLGQLDLVQTDDGWEVEDYVLHEINDDIPGDAAVTEKVSGFVDAIDDTLDLGFAFNDPIAVVPATIELPECEESPLGDFVTDAYRHSITALDPNEPIRAAFEAQGVIRTPMLEGNTGVQAFSDIFRVLPLGAGEDTLPGYALTAFYAYPYEILDACEITASLVPDFGCSFFLEVSGMRCSIFMPTLQTNRAQTLELWDEDTQSWEAIDTSSSNTELYRIVANTYLMALVPLVEEETGGAITIQPKDAQGNVHPYTDFLVDADPDKGGVQEYKLWAALADYAASFPDDDGDGLPDIPSSYLKADGRITGFELPE